MGLTPEYRVLANAADITAAIALRLISLRFTDEAGIQSDVLELVLADNDPLMPIQVPPDGAELELFLGYDGQAQRMGLFVFDELEMAGWPGEMTIRARAAILDKSKSGKNQLQTQKSRTWAKDTKLADLVAKIAKEHSMEPAVSQSLKSITLPATYQTDESDLHFLTRIAKKYDAVVKPAGGKLVVAKNGESKSTTGEQLPPVTLTPGEVSSWRAVQSKRETAGQVVAYWHAVKNAKRKSVKVGTGEPVTRLKMWYPTQEMALSAARSELDRRTRAKKTLSITLPGRTDLQAEAPLTLAGFRDGVDGEWVITRVEHSLDKSTGYQCTIEAETPNASETPQTEEVEETGATA